MGTIKQIFRPKEFTGYHMWGVLILFFGTIITVNLIMARYAITTWTGLVVKNTYVASQEFNEKAAEAKAISALGYTVVLGSTPTAFFLDLSDKTGAPAESTDVTVRFHHPVGQIGDRTLNLTSRGRGRFAADEALPEGEWIGLVIAMIGDKPIYKRAHRIHINRDGTLR